ncbi:hypothetical protein PMAYCL1PPCAC_25277, partial [Pristionchus mayeri]
TMSADFDGNEKFYLNLLREARAEAKALSQGEFVPETTITTAKTTPPPSLFVTPLETSPTPGLMLTTQDTSTTSGTGLLDQESSDSTMMFMWPVISVCSLLVFTITALLVIHACRKCWNSRPKLPSYPPPRPPIFQTDESNHYTSYNQSYLTPDMRRRRSEESEGYYVDLTNITDPSSQK